MGNWDDEKWVIFGEAWNEMAPLLKILFGFACVFAVIFVVAALANG